MPAPTLLSLRRWLLPSLFTALTAHAAPDAGAPPPAEGRSAEAVLQMLHDKGLLPDPAQIGARVEQMPLVRQVRDAASDLVVSAMNFIGVRYRRGGSSAEQGFDCSGFTRAVFENSIGLVLPRRADQQARQAGLETVGRSDELRPGDLVFFNTMRRAFSHVGIYVGEGKFIHAPRPGGEVRIEDMRQTYWSKRYNGARRADLPLPDTTAAVRPPSS